MRFHDDSVAPFAVWENGSTDHRVIGSPRVLGLQRLDHKNVNMIIGIIADRVSV